jgi:predicted metal-dependent hydrolase
METEGDGRWSEWAPPVRVVASPNRHRTVSARMVEGVMELRVPASMPAAERQRWAERMRARLERQLRRARPTDADLDQRAQALNRRHFGGRLRWTSIAYAEQTSRWGSCSFGSGVIRISTRAARLPAWVLDYLLVHELTHLEVPNHGPRFWALVHDYPLTERARGYLIAMDHAAGRATDEESPED